MKTYSAYVGRVPVGMSQEVLKSTFEPCGVVVAVFIQPVSATTSAHTFGFVRFTDKLAVGRAVRTLNGTTIGGMRICVQVAHQEESEAKGGFNLLPEKLVKTCSGATDVTVQNSERCMRRLWMVKEACLQLEEEQLNEQGISAEQDDDVSDSEDSSNLSATAPRQRACSQRQHRTVSAEVAVPGKNSVAKLVSALHAITYGVADMNAVELKQEALDLGFIDRRLREYMSDFDRGHSSRPASATAMMCCVTCDSVNIHSTVIGDTCAVKTAMAGTHQAMRSYIPVKKEMETVLSTLRNGSQMGRMIVTAHRSSLARATQSASSAADAAVYQSDTFARVTSAAVADDNRVHTGTPAHMRVPISANSLSKMSESESSLSPWPERSLMVASAVSISSLESDDSGKNEFSSTSLSLDSIIDTLPGSLHGNGDTDWSRKSRDSGISLSPRLSPLSMSSLSPLSTLSPVNCSCLQTTQFSVSLGAVSQHAAPSRAILTPDHLSSSRVKAPSGRGRSLLDIKF